MPRVNDPLRSLQIPGSRLGLKDPIKLRSHEPMPGQAVPRARAPERVGLPIFRPAPLVVAQTREVCPALRDYVFDIQGAVNMTVAGLQVICQWTVPIDYVGLCKRMGWLVAAPGAGAAVMAFYIDEAPVPGLPRATFNAYAPVSSIDFDRLLEVNIMLEGGHTFSIRADLPAIPAIPYIISARLWGWYWRKNETEDGQRNYR